ncbi:putative GABA permease [Aspergillus fischeri NRRL 181]|uniref:Choline transporter, putative n=1 Tax=Neosartorya fischeri (strain ATCC 1020 / DSM 3700 / CBS 544.65 / FGSC A1164 / JCM 1740 / NRRL 181 / WB 181) TaxID=331117 RepID=A1DAS8_NEOFI|nr:Choline transporter, putative [Aspergillus fischeri NRRL 181]EAW19968.1 Choline transporter, putative [Aspergillus fischeri NRRL 181]
MSFTPSESGSSSPAQLAKNFSRISLLGLAFITLNSWTAFASALPLSLTSGGPTSIIWGLLTAGVCTLCIAASLAEFLSAYPTAAGQYRWVAVSWDDYKRVLSWFTAWANVAAWICLCATASLFGSQLVTDTVILVHPDFNFLRWHVFLIYVGFNVIALLVNAFWNSILSALNKAALIWSLCGFFIIFVTVLACASPNYNSASFVFTSFINETGWPDGLAWLLGLLQGGLCLVGVDAVAHMIEEIPKPTVDGPLIMVACVAIGLATSLIFIVALLFVSRDMDTIITAGAGPLLQIFFDATNSKVGSICLLLFPIGCLLLGVVAITTTSSRMIYALARDSGLPFSSIWTTVHARLKTPVNALALNTAAVICCGCVFLGSSSAFNALSAATVICFDISYCLPILIHCIRGRKLLPARPWSLYPVIGWIVNLVSIAYISFTTVLFMFPPARPVTGSTMNYAIAATGVFALLSAIYWFVRGRKRFMQVLLNAEMEFPEARPSTGPIKSDV